MLDYRIRAFIFLIIGIILIIGGFLVGIVDKDFKLLIKMVVIGIAFIIASIALKRWYKKQ